MLDSLPAAGPEGETSRGRGGEVRRARASLRESLALLGRTWPNGLLSCLPLVRCSVRAVCGRRRFANFLCSSRSRWLWMNGAVDSSFVGVQSLRWQDHSFKTTSGERACDCMNQASGQTTLESKATRPDKDPHQFAQRHCSIPESEAAAAVVAWWLRCFLPKSSLAFACPNIVNAEYV